MDNKEYRMAHQQKPAQPESLQISKNITRDNWDQCLIAVLDFLYNREGWKRSYAGLTTSFQQIQHGLLLTYEQVIEQTEKEMWSRVRFFQYHGYALEPPDWEEQLMRLEAEALRVGEPGIMRPGSLRNPCAEMPL